MKTDVFASRHIGIRPEDIPHMLRNVEAGSLDQLIDETIPEDIRISKKPHLDPPISEHLFLEHINELSKKNKLFQSYLVTYLSK